MQLGKRIFLFLAVNFCVIITLSLILSIFNVQPYLQQQGLNVQSLIIFCLIWGMGGAFISLLLSKTMAKWMMGVRIVDGRDAQSKKLIDMVRRLSQKARLPEVPQVGIFPSNEMNAFATGATKRSSLVAVSQGLLDQMSDEEVEGVIAHELAHIANGDMVTMTLLQGVVNAFVMFLSRLFAYALSSRERNNGRTSPFAFYMFVILFEVAFMALGSLIVCKFSRWREFRADRGGARVAGKEKMIAALERLKGQQSAPAMDQKGAAINAMMISRPKRSGFMALYATHPPLEERIAALRNLR